MFERYCQSSFQAPQQVLLTVDQKYPIPFNPRTTLSFKLPEAGPTRLEILDLRGLSVRIVVEGWLESGTHTRRPIIASA